MRAIILVLALLAAPLSGVASAETGLLGRSARFQIRTYDRPAEPYFQTQMQKAVVDGRVEFIVTEDDPAQNGLSAVPVVLDVQNRRIEGAIAATLPGAFAEAAFNGYVIELGGGCVRLDAIRIDEKETNLGLTADRVFLQDGALYINVAGLPFDEETTFAFDLDLQECLISLAPGLSLSSPARS